MKLVMTYLSKKINLYGLATDTLGLIKSFLSDRRQLVSVKSKELEVKSVVFGVPQGSVLGLSYFPSIVMTSNYI